MLGVAMRLFSKRLFAHQPFAALAFNPKSEKPGRTKHTVIEVFAKESSKSNSNTASRRERRRQRKRSRAQDRDDESNEYDDDDEEEEEELSAIEDLIDGIEEREEEGDDRDRVASSIRATITFRGQKTQYVLSRFGTYSKLMHYSQRRWGINGNTNYLFVDSVTRSVLPFASSIRGDCSLHLLPFRTAISVHKPTNTDKEFEEQLESYQRDCERSSAATIEEEEGEERITIIEEEDVKEEEDRDHSLIIEKRIRRFCTIMRKRFSSKDEAAERFRQIFGPSLWKKTISQFREDWSTVIDPNISRRLSEPHLHSPGNTLSRKEIKKIEDNILISTLSDQLWKMISRTITESLSLNTMQKETLYSSFHQMIVIDQESMENIKLPPEVLADLSNPMQWYPIARQMKRKIIMHLGPTNSGKTHEALQELIKSTSGVYCGPLRILAWEIYEKLNSLGLFFPFFFPDHITSHHITSHHIKRDEF